MCCPNCGQSTRAGLVRCHHCNYKLPAESVVPQEAGSLQTITCWNCAHSNPATAARCQHCNARLQPSAGNSTVEHPTESGSQQNEIEHL